MTDDAIRRAVEELLAAHGPEAVEVAKDWLADALEQQDPAGINYWSAVLPALVKRLASRK